MNPAPAELLQLLTNCSTSAIVADATYPALLPLNRPINHLQKRKSRLARLNQAMRLGEFGDGFNGIYFGFNVPLLIGFFAFARIKNFCFRVAANSIT